MNEHIRPNHLMNPRRIGRRVDLAPPKQGFLGPGHLVVEVVTPSDLAATDPFVLLMDDRVDYPAGRALGEAHPHAGLETVTFVVDGTLAGAGGEGKLNSGDVIWMTAGSGVVHGGEFRAPGGPMRFLQLWLTLPERQRAATPRFTHLPAAEMPVFRASGVEARLYSGSTNGLVSPTPNHVPVTLVDVRLEAGASFEQELPPRYNGLLYPLSGGVVVANESEALGSQHVGWLDAVDEATPSVLRVVGGPEGARFLLYCGERQNEPTVQKGPFVAGSVAAIEQMHLDYRAGRFVRTAAPI
jgi:redox-sensitive bicupin YhaK (pirin superfamily)